MRKICVKFVPRVLREDQKERRCHDNREMVELINLDPTVLGALGTCNENWIYCYDRETKRQSSHAGSLRPKEARQSKSTHKLLMILFLTVLAWSTCTGSSRPDCIFEIHQQSQSGFSRVYSNCCCSCSFEPEIIKIGRSSHKMYSNNILNFQVSTTILNARTKESGKVPRTVQTVSKA